jgi:hypothetical protein
MSGRAIADADPQDLRLVIERLRHLVEEVPTLEPADQWPLYGALLVNLRNIAEAMTDVATANPLGQPPMPLARLREGARHVS